MVLADRFRDDFTTNLRGWTPRGDVRRSVKVGDHLVLRVFPGRASSMVRRVGREIPEGTCLAVEAAVSDNTVDIQVVASGSPPQAVRLTQAFHETLLPLQAGRLDEFGILMPASGQEIAIRRIRLILPPVAPQRAQGTAIATALGREWRQVH